MTGEEIRTIVEQIVRLRNEAIDLELKLLDHGILVEQIGSKVSVRREMYFFNSAYGEWSDGSKTSQD